MATKLADKAKAGAQPRQVHAGGVTVKAKYVLSDDAEALSAGDVIQMVKVPHGAVIDDMTVFMGSVGDHKVVVTIGDGGSATRFFGSASLSLTIGAAITMSDGFGYQYDISDDAANQYDTIDITIGTVTSSTVTGTITMILQYHCDEAQP